MVVRQGGDSEKWVKCGDPRMEQLLGREMKTLVSPPHGEHLLILESKEYPRNNTEPQDHHSFSPERTRMDA